MPPTSHQHEHKPYITLHCLVALLAFTAILGELVSIEAIPLVAWRTLIAAIFLFLLLGWRDVLQFNYKRKAILTGTILGAHWLAFFGAINLANVTICLIGLATTSLFTAATEAIAEKRKPYSHELLLGFLIIPGIILIAGVEQGHLLGLLCGILSAFLAAIFPVFNKTMVRAGAKPTMLTFYEMLGAFAISLLAGVVFRIPLSGYQPFQWDWLWIALLAIVCTVYSFSLYVHLLKKFSAYETTLAINFEPVYGIILAAVLFNEHKDMHPLFFLGALIILVVNFLHPVLERRSRRANMKATT